MGSPSMLVNIKATCLGRVQKSRQHPDFPGGHTTRARGCLTWQSERDTVCQPITAVYDNGCMSSVEVLVLCRTGGLRTHTLYHYVRRHAHTTSSASSPFSIVVWTRSNTQIYPAGYMIDSKQHSTARTSSACSVEMCSFHV